MMPLSWRSFSPGGRMPDNRKSRRRTTAACASRAESVVPAVLSGSGDRFVLKSRLGAGGMCEVFSAIDLRRVECGDAQPTVAVKRLLPEMAAQRLSRSALVHEYRTLRGLTHPGVVRVFDLHREGWGMCFSMELLDGGSAHAVLGGHPAGLGRGGIPVAGRIFEALSYLHAQGVTHGDIKPANMFLERAGRAVLLDFQTAQARPLPGVRACGPESARAPGISLLHASPEVLEDALPSPPADVFSACLSVIEVLTGQHPFRMLPANEAMVIGVMPERPPFLGIWQWRLLLAGLSPDVRMRPTARQLAAGFTGSGWLERLCVSYCQRLQERRNRKEWGGDA